MIVTFPLFLTLIMIGMPIVFALGVTAWITLVVTTDVTTAVMAQRLYAGLDSFSLLAIPFFILAGLLMEVGGIARRIVDFAASLVGWLTGGLLMVAIVAGAGLAAISGSGSADTAAISSVMLPEMRRRRYNIDFAAGILAAAGCLGPIIPPSILMVVLATMSNLSVGAMFLGGVLPGILMMFGLMLAAYIHARKGGPAYQVTERFSLRKVGTTFVAAIPALVMPIIIVGGIVGGVFTPTEAAAVVVAYGLIVSLGVYREMKLSDLPRVILRAAALSAAVMTIVGTASIFSWLIATQDVPGQLGGFLRSVSTSANVYLLIVNVLLLIVGMFMESISAILILMPVLMPIAVSYGIDPLHFGLIVVINLSVGLVTPPYGICLFVACTIAGRSVVQVSRHLALPILTMVITLFICTYVPEVAMFLPNLAR